MSADTDLDAKLAEHGDRPVILFFGTNNCGPTISMWDTIAGFEDATENAYPVIPINVEDSPTTAQRFAVKATPWFTLVKAGEPVASIQGTMTMDQMTDWVARSLMPKSIKKSRKAA